MENNSVAPHPVVAIKIEDGTILVNGETVEHDGHGDPYVVAAHAAATRVAVPLGRPVRAIATDGTSKTSLVVHPDGSTSDVESEALVEAPAKETEVASLEQLLAGPTAPELPVPGTPQAAAAARSEGAAQTQLPPPAAAPRAGGRRSSFVVDESREPSIKTPGKHERPSFITAGRSVQPAQQGFRGWLNKLGFRLNPGPQEISYRRDVAAVSQHFPGPRTVAVVNPKGSASKTPTTACLAAVFARLGGAGVLAWDNNETRGSLLWRTEKAPHEATVLNLLPRVDALMAQTAQYAEMGHYVHHQPADKYDVLASDQSVEGDHVVSAEDVDAVHQVASRYYRLAVVDSGNSERAPNWREMVRHANRLVVPCTNVEDTPEAGALMLDALSSRDEHSAALAERAVVIVSQRTKGKDPDMARIVGNFEQMGHTVVTIPYDPALKSGLIRFDALRPATQRAWLRAAAAVAEGL